MIIRKDSPATDFAGMANTVTEPSSGPGLGMEEYSLDIGAMCRPVSRTNSIFSSSAFVLSATPVLKTADFEYLYPMDDVLGDSDTLGAGSDQLCEQDLTGWANSISEEPWVPELNYLDTELYFSINDPYLSAMQTATVTPMSSLLEAETEEGEEEEGDEEGSHETAMTTDEDIFAEPSMIETSADPDDFINVQPAAVERSGRLGPASEASSPTPSTTYSEGSMTHACTSALSIFGRVPEGQITQLLKKMVDHKPARGRRRCKQLAEMTAEEIEVERVMRVEKSRLSARECRQRKRGIVEELHKEIDDWQRRDSQSQKVIHALQEENKQLHTALDSLRLSVDSTAAGSSNPWRASGSKPAGAKSSEKRSAPLHDTRHGGKTPGSPRLTQRLMRS